MSYPAEQLAGSSGTPTRFGRRVHCKTGTLALGKLEAMSIEGDPSVYAEYMNEIKWRMAYFDSLREKNSRTFSVTEIESLALQMRMIFEVIALSTIASHREAFEASRKHILKDWKLSRIVKSVKKMNPNYFPVPIKEELVAYSEFDLIRHIPVENDHLTEIEMVSNHGHLGNILHARSRYKDDLDCSDLLNRLLVCKDRIIRLLNKHVVTLYGEKRMIFVMMKGPSGDVTWEYCRKVEPNDWPNEIKGTKL